MASAFRISPDSSVPILSATCRTVAFSASVTAAEMRCSRLSGITSAPRATNSTRQSSTRIRDTPTSARRGQSYARGCSVAFGFTRSRLSPYRYGVILSAMDSPCRRKKSESEQGLTPAMRANCSCVTPRSFRKFLRSVCMLMAQLFTIQ